MINVEKKDIAQKIGVENILVNYYAELGYKTSLTIILNKDLLLNYIGKTYSFIPLTGNGLGKKLSNKDVNELLDKVINELSKEIGAEVKENKNTSNRDAR